MRLDSGQYGHLWSAFSGSAGVLNLHMATVMRTHRRPPRNSGKWKLIGPPHQKRKVLEKASVIGRGSTPKHFKRGTTTFNGQVSLDTSMLWTNPEIRQFNEDQQSASHQASEATRSNKMTDLFLVYWITEVKGFQLNETITTKSRPLHPSGCLLMYPHFLGIMLQTWG